MGHRELRDTKQKNRKHGELESTDNMGIKGTQIQRTKGYMNTCRDSENTGIRILITYYRNTWKQRTQGYRENREETRIQRTQDRYTDT